MSLSDLDKIIGEVRTNAQMGWVGELYGSEKVKKVFSREKQKKNERQPEGRCGVERLVSLPTMGDIDHVCHLKGMIL